MKKFLALLMAAMMLLAMTTAFAVDYTINYPTTGIAADHTYEVYQIFKGDPSTDDTGAIILSNVVWGENAASGYTKGDVVADEILEAIRNLTGSEKEKASKIAEYANLESKPVATLKKDKLSATVPAGYYLIKDANNSLAGTPDAYTTYIVTLTSPMNIAPKAVSPTVDKEVLDEPADAEDGDKSGWGESADHAINESFQFRLTAELPASDKYADYKEYKVTFVDTMSEGITFEDIVSVSVDGVSSVDKDGKVVFTYSDTTNKLGTYGGSWELCIDDVKAIKDVNLTDGAEIVVVYSAHLNEKAQIDKASVDSTANENSVKLKFSNNPYADGEGETPEDFVWVFTYAVNNTKYANVEAEENKLPGAGFTLYAGETPIKLIDNKDGTYTVANQNAETGYVTEMVTGADGKFNILGLDAGTYTLKETKVPEGFNKLDDFTIIIKATHAENDAETDASMTLDEASTMNNDHVNKSGATLPETGGIGTTLFYLFGSLMTAGSALILVVRRRAEAEEE